MATHIVSTGIITSFVWGSLTMFESLYNNCPRRWGDRGKTILSSKKPTNSTTGPSSAAVSRPHPALRGLQRCIVTLDSPPAEQKPWRLHSCKLLLSSWFGLSLSSSVKNTSKYQTSFDINEDGILLIIKNLNVDKTRGWDNLSLRMRKICGKSIALPLRLIFRSMLLEGVFPAWGRVSWRLEEE